MYVLDQLRQVIDRHAIIADVSRDDIGGQCDERVIIAIIVHRFNPELEKYWRDGGTPSRLYFITTVLF